MADQLSKFSSIKMNWRWCNNGIRPCDPEANLRCAISIYKTGGNTWKLWATRQACGC
jgi:hypothetical protein